MTITDTDYNTQGVTKYRVYAKIGAPASEADPYQEVTSPGMHDIDLSALSPSGINPLNADRIHFLVVAFDADERKSKPTSKDRSSVSWDKAGPNQPTGITFGISAQKTMTLRINSQVSDSDLDHFEVYLKNGTAATFEDNQWSNVNYPRTFTNQEYVNQSGRSLYIIGAQDGNEIYVAVYAVDKYGNRSVPATDHATYSETPL